MSDDGTDGTSRSSVHSSLHPKTLVRYEAAMQAYERAGIQPGAAAIPWLDTKYAIATRQIMVHAALHLADLSDEDRRQLQAAADRYRLARKAPDAELSANAQKQRQAGISWEAVTQKRDELLEQYVFDADGAAGFPSKLKARQGMMDALILSLYTLMPPRRNELAEMGIIGPRDPLTPAGNFYILDLYGHDRMHFADYKTVDKYGEVQFHVPARLEAIIRQTFMRWPRHTLLATMRGKATRTYLSQRVGKIIPRLTVNYLRKLAKTEWSRRGLPNAPRLADAMGHGVAVAEHVYNLDSHLQKTADMDGMVIPIKIDLGMHA